MSDETKPHGLTYSTYTARDGRRAWLRTHLAAALGVVGFAAAMVQAPWYVFAAVASWLFVYGDTPMSSAEDTQLAVFLLLPSIAGLLLGAIAMVFSRQRWGRSSGVAAWFIVAAHAGMALYVTGAAGANRLFHLFGMR